MYEINVSKNGEHYFATAKRSSQTIAHSGKPREGLADFKRRFPESEGFKVTMVSISELHEEIV